MFLLPFMTVFSHSHSNYAFFLTSPHISSPCIHPVSFYIHLTFLFTQSLIHAYIHSFTHFLFPLLQCLSSLPPLLYLSYSHLSLHLSTSNLFLYLHSQAARVTHHCDKLKQTGFYLRSRPFQYSKTPQSDLDSYLAFTQSAKLRVSMLHEAFQFLCVHRQSPEVQLMLAMYFKTYECHHNCLCTVDSHWF